MITSYVIFLYAVLPAKYIMYNMYYKSSTVSQSIIEYTIIKLSRYTHKMYTKNIIKIIKLRKRRNQFIELKTIIRF